MTTQIQQFPSSVVSVGSHKHALVLILAASREVDGAYVPLVDAQKDAALAGAKAALQCVGAEVEASSTGYLLPETELAENERLTLRATLELEKSVAEV